MKFASSVADHNALRHLYALGSRSAWLGFVLAALFCDSTSACKYTVRDVAFVDMDGSWYELVLLLDGETPKDIAEVIRTTAIQGLAESNVQFEMVDIDNNATQTQLALLRSHEIDRFPAAVLVSPDGRSRQISLPDLKSEQSVALRNTIQSLVSSALRESLLEKLVDLHSAVLIIESDNPKLNERALAMVELAIERVEAALPDLPKPIEVPPQVWAVDKEEAQREAILLWSLGVDVTASDVPQMALVFGRGRNLGRVIELSENAEKELLHALAVAGLDCECELDRSWMQSPMFPHVWTEAHESQAARSLGFDPGHPLVKVEMSRILSRGPSSSDLGTRNSPDALLPGLQIIDLNFDDEQASPSPVAVEEPNDSNAFAEKQPTPSSKSHHVDNSLKETNNLKDSIPAQVVQSRSGSSNTTSSGSLAKTVGSTVLGIVVVGLAGGAIVVFYSRRLEP